MNNNELLNLDEALDYLNDTELVQEVSMNKFLKNKSPKDIIAKSNIFGLKNKPKHFNAPKDKKNIMSMQEFNKYIDEKIDKCLKSSGCDDYFTIGFFEKHVVNEDDKLYMSIYAIYPKNKADAYDENGNRISTTTNEKYIENFKKFSSHFNKNKNELLHADIFPKVVMYDIMHNTSYDADFIMVSYSTDATFAMS